MNLYTTMLVLFTLLWAHLAGAQDSAAVLPAEARQARDAQRLAAAQARLGAQQQSQRAAQTRRRQQRRELEQLTRALADSADAERELSATRDRVGQDLGVVHAVAKSAAQEHLQRLLTGPLGAADEPRMDQARDLLDAPASLDTLYGVWYALHGELAQSANAVHFRAPVTHRDGIRQSRRVTRYGAVMLTADGLPLAHHPVDGLMQLPAGAALPKPSRDLQFVAQQIYDSGFIGGLVLVCALLGLTVALLQGVRLAWLAAGRGTAARAPPDSDRYLGVIGSAALLLGLLGTVVGLIHTFRALALYGGADTSLAAAGIAHALATTWMGLSVAIPLALVQGVLRAGRLRVVRRMAHVDAVAPRTGKGGVPGALVARAVRGMRALRTGTCFALGVLLASALFFLMQWLTLRPLVAPDGGRETVVVQRIDWDLDPPPPPPEPRAPAAQAADAVAGTPFDLPPLMPADAPALALTMPALDLDASLLGAEFSGGALAGAGAEWLVGGGADAFTGSDLIPISSARPKYPRAAARERIEGWVELMFTINADGTVHNVRVIDAEPPGVFELAAASAMGRWLYAPLYRDGRPVQREATQLFRFHARDIAEDYLYERD